MTERRVVRRSFKTPTATSINEQKPNNDLQWRIIVRVILYVLVISILFYAIIVSNLFKIENIKIEGSQTLNHTEATSQVKAVLTGSLLNQNILFVPSSQISDQLKSSNSQIATVRVTREFMHTIKVTITEQKPAILWQSGSTISVITQDGKAYIGDPSEELKQTLPKVIDTTNLPVKAGERVVLPNFTNFVEKTFATLPAQGIEVSDMQVEETTTELIVNTKSGYYIRFDTTRPFDEQNNDLQAVIDTLKQQNKKPSQYIDLRINSKAFYK